MFVLLNKKNDQHQSSNIIQSQNTPGNQIVIIVKGRFQNEISTQNRTDREWKESIARGEEGEIVLPPTPKAKTIMSGFRIISMTMRECVCVCVCETETKKLTSSEHRADRYPIYQQTRKSFPSEYSSSH